MEIVGATFRVRGLVQGVGLRPTVWRLAQARGLAGDVCNDGEGVLIHAWGAPQALIDFEGALRQEAPPLARIDSIERSALSGLPPSQDFRIVASEGGRVRTAVAADAATCPACLADILDPSNRRYRYPFTNCTHCGPRLSIVRSIPYDRATTSMGAFEMCSACQREYEDPRDRRFHAEPNACPQCGPKVWLEDRGGRRFLPSGSLDVLGQAAALLADGALLAVKGIGGFHLACDARNAVAVAELRHRKRRYDKPFALMARSLDAIRSYAQVDDEAARLLQDRAAPIVLLPRTRHAAGLPDAVAPHQVTLGFMLPYTPLHHLLMASLEGPIVLTSGNVSDEPQCIENEEAHRQLAGIADVFLMHDRAIVNRLDDSVVMCGEAGSSVIRRARGYAPQALSLPDELRGAPPVLAMGAELKSTFCLAADGQAIVSQHMGDLETVATHADYRGNLELYRQIFQFTPHVIAVDKHKDYLSTKWGRQLAEQAGGRLIEVQHHHAHVAAVLAEEGREPTAPAVLGIVLDGLGMGEESALWGGEFLLADYRRSTRLAAFDAVALLGGDRAAREPWRNAFAHLHRAFGWTHVDATWGESDIVRYLLAKQPAVLARMIEAGVNAPTASSAGRLFDAVAAVLGLCRERVSYEGQAAIALEAAAWGTPGAATYPVELVPGEPPRLVWRAFWAELLADLARGTDVSVIAARAHASVAAAVAQTAAQLCAAQSVATVVLSGGVFQNRLLVEQTSQRLRRDGLEVLLARRVPANDGGISLGQAVIAAVAAGDREGRPSS